MPGQIYKFNYRRQKHYSDNLLVFAGISLIIGLAILINLLPVIFLSLISGNILNEFFKWFQLLSLLILLFYLLCPLGRISAFFILFVLFLVYLILTFYHFITHNQLDFYFIYRNILNIKPVLISFWPWIISAIGLAIISAAIFYKILQRAKQFFKLKITILVFSITFLLFGVFSPFKLWANNELIYFTKSIFRRSQVINAYQNYYQQLIQKNTKNKAGLLKQIQNAKNRKFPSYLDNVVILQIESLNGFLVNKKITPQFLSLAKQGILFKNFYGNSVQTILGQENILCSLPSSFDFNLVKANNDQNILCLPAIFKNLGYQTIFLKTYDLAFAHTGDFMRHIGFNEVYANDIMRPGDPKYVWGYREDVFFQRALEFIKKNKKEKNFIYLEIGPTSHWPFNIPSDYRGPIPYPQPDNFKERLSNTLFIQDQYLKTAWQEINKLWPKKNYTILILGDHSWPTGFHPNNTFNEKGAYEENFRTALVMILGNKNKFQNIIIDEKYSQIDIMPSLMDLMGINLPANNIRQSFIPAITSSDPAGARHLIVLVQPYGQRYLSIVRENDKFLYNAGLNQFIKYNLKTDPEEQNGEIIGRDSKQNLKILNSLLNSN